MQHCLSFQLARFSGHRNPSCATAILSARVLDTVLPLHSCQVAEHCNVSVPPGLMGWPVVSALIQDRAYRCTLYAEDTTAFLMSTIVFLAIYKSPDVLS